MGAGFLTIPSVFQSGGWVLGVLLQVVFCLEAIWLAQLMIDCMSRCEVLACKSEEGRPLNPVKFSEVWRCSYKAPNSLLAYDRHIQIEHEPSITDRRLDVTEIVRLLFGGKWAKIYLMLLSLVMLGILTAYCAIFASSFAANIPLNESGPCNIYETSGFYNDCKWRYWVFLILFFIIEACLVLASFSEQRWLQAVMTGMRIAVIVVIIVTCIAAILTDTRIDDDGGNNAGYSPPFNPAMIASSVLIPLFAYLYHAQLPNIAQFVTNKQANLGRMTAAVSVTCFTAYMLLGLITPAAIRKVPGLCTLAYHNYSAGYSTRPWWTYIISMIVILCPALDVMSSFPIIAISVAENILSLTHVSLSVDKINKTTVVLVKLSVVTIPSILSFLDYNIATILSWTTYIAFLVICFAIPLMYIAGKILVPESSPYAAKFASPCWTTIFAGSQMVLVLLLLMLSIVDLAAK
jgi:amino acid permease